VIKTLIAQLQQQQDNNLQVQKISSYKKQAENPKLT